MPYKIYIDVELDEVSKEEFLEYIKDEISSLEDQVLKLENGTKKGLSQFRMDLHSLKGAGGSYGFLYITEVCHVIEDLLQLRGEEKFDRVFVDIILSKLDSIKKYINIFETSKSESELLEKLREFEEEKKLGVVIEGARKTKILICDPKKSLKTLISNSELSNKIDASYVDLGLTAISRVLSENWDYMLISNQLKDIKGLSVLYALKSSEKPLPKIIFVSTGNLKFLDQFKPDYFIQIDDKFINKLKEVVTT